MKVLHVVHQFLPETRGGLETYVHDLAVSQVEAGLEVEVFSGSMEPTEAFELRRSEASDQQPFAVSRAHRADLYFDAWDKSACPQIRKLFEAELARFQPDLIHLHHWIRLGKDLVTSASEARVPVVVTLHDFAASCPRAFRVREPGSEVCDRPVSVESCLGCVPRWPWNQDEEIRREIDWFRRLSLAELGAANAILAASRSVIETVSQGLAIELERSEVIPLAYASRFPNKETSPRERAEDPTFRFAYWGAVTERKGVRLLVEAFGDLLAGRQGSDRPIALEVFGGIDTPELEAELRGAASAAVTFHGRFEYEDLRRSKIDVAVFPSLCLETYGFVLDEAFELSLPVVVPGAGALGERSGVAGEKFEIQDRGDLARALGAMVNDPARYEARRAAIPDDRMSASDHESAVRRVYDRAVREGAISAPKSWQLSAADRAAHAFLREEALFRRHLERP